jgi:hypothetical protein
MKINAASSFHINNYIIGDMMDNESKLRALQKMIEGSERMASEAELDHLQLGKDRPLAASLKERKGLSTGGALKEVDALDLKESMKNIPTIDDLAKQSPSMNKSSLMDKTIGSRMGSIDELDEIKRLSSGSKMPSKSQLASIGKGSTKVAKEASDDMFARLAKKVGAKGFGKVAGMVAGLPLMLASEGADASELGPESGTIDGDLERGTPIREQLSKAKDNELFSNLRSLKDDRRDKILEGQKGDAGLREMMDIREDIRDVADSDKTLEERERLAQKQLDETRKKKGLSHSPIMQDQGEDL